MFSDVGIYVAVSYNFLMTDLLFFWGDNMNTKTTNQSSSHFSFFSFSFLIASSFPLLLFFFLRPFLLCRFSFILAL
jgi:hypothetical protein